MTAISICSIWHHFADGSGFTKNKHKTEGQRQSIHYFKKQSVNTLFSICNTPEIVARLCDMKYKKNGTTRVCEIVKQESNPNLEALLYSMGYTQSFLVNMQNKCLPRQKLLDQ